MAIWDKLFTSFKSASKKVAGTSAKTVSKTATKNVATNIVKKPATVNTATKIYTESSGSSILKNQAKAIAGSTTVKTTGKVAAGSIIIGGAAYGLGSLAGKGMESVGYGWRDLTNTHTDNEDAQDALKNRAQSQELDQKQFDFLKGFYDWANKNGYSDSPSTREFYDQYINGQGSQNTPNTEGSNGINPWIIGAGALAAAAGIYLLTKKKKGSKK